MQAGIELVGSTYEDYLGAWTLVSYGSAIVGEKGYQFTETPLQFNVRIEKDVEGQSYKVYGWNADTEFANANPFIMNYDPKETEGIGGWLNIPLAPGGQDRRQYRLDALSEIPLRRNLLLLHEYRYG